MERRGFSLIEVMVSMALVFFFLMGTGALVLRSIQAKKNVDDRLALAEAAVSRLESLKPLPFESGDLAAGFYEGEIESPSPETTRAEWRIDLLLPGIKKIDLQIYPENMPEHVLQAVLLFSKYLGF